MKSPTPLLKKIVQSPDPQPLLEAQVANRVRFALRHHLPTDALVNRIVKVLKKKHPNAYLLAPRPFGVLVRKVWSELP